MVVIEGQEKLDNMIKNKTIRTQPDPRCNLPEPHSLLFYHTEEGGSNMDIEKDTSVLTGSANVGANEAAKFLAGMGNEEKMMPKLDAETPVPEQPDARAIEELKKQNTASITKLKKSTASGTGKNVSSKASWNLAKATTTRVERRSNVNSRR